MKPLVIYHSETGNTVAVAEAMARTLGADLATAESTSSDQLQQRPLIGLGSGIYYLKHHKSIYALIEQIPAGARVFLFTTSGVILQPAVRYYQNRLAGRLRRRGLDVVGQWHCPGFDQQPLLKPFGINRGRPNEQDLQAAAEFASKLPG